MEHVKISMTPKASLSICHVTQNDNGREVSIDFEDYTLTGAEDVSLIIRKPDGTRVETALENTASDFVIWSSDPSECDVVGLANCEIKAEDDGVVLYSASFNMNIEADPYGSDVTTSTATGNPCTFTTDLADALVSLTADIVCGGGGGTPSNPIPIVGHSELNLDVNGQTFTIAFGQTVYGGHYDKSGRLTITHGYIEYDGSNDESWRIGEAGGYTRMMIAKSDAYDSASRSEVVCNIGQYASSGNDYCMTFLYNADIFYYPPAEITTIEDFRTWLSSNNLKIVYPLATPIEIDVQSISVFAENGTNNITSDCGGDVDVTYIKKV